MKKVLEKKLRKLKNILKDMKSTVLAYSGGVDSTFLLKVAGEVLGRNILAVTAVSPTYTEEEFKLAKKTAVKFGARHLAVRTHEFRNPDFTSNPVNRCYYCKKELLANLCRIARAKKIRYVIEGTNMDDLADFRPGMKAVRETGVRSPLKEAGFTKDDIRALSRAMGLPTWDKPASPCLASRFPYGHRITRKKLEMVREAEKYLKKQGFPVVRVRHHGEIARIEVPPGDLGRLCTGRTAGRIAEKLGGIGYRYITADIMGFRSGSMNPERKRSRGN